MYIYFKSHSPSLKVEDVSQVMELIESEEENISAVAEALEFDFWTTKLLRKVAGFLKQSLQNRLVDNEYLLLSICVTRGLIFLDAFDLFSEVKFRWFSLLRLIQIFGLAISWLL